jgi:hypothetical protein
MKEEEKQWTSGELLKSISRESLSDGSQAPLQITSAKYITSYNWLPTAGGPIILVPGKLENTRLITRKGQVIVRFQGNIFMV